VFLAAGFLIGFYGAGIFARARVIRTAHPRAMAGTIMTKRMLAINAALKNGRTEYEFNFLSPSPVLGRQ
jgi:hypothetical protein